MKQCSGFFIPRYKQTRQTQKNPFYLSSEADRLGHVNTTDEFLSILVYEEVESICVDCKQSKCKGYYEETLS